MGYYPNSFKVRDQSGNVHLEQEIDLNFNPLNKQEQQIQGNQVLKGILEIAKNKNFEQDTLRSMAKDMSTLAVTRTKTPSHGEIFSIEVHNKIADWVEGQFEDGLFPAESKSILGFGKNAKGAARDSSAMSFESMPFTWKRASEMMQDV